MSGTDTITGKLLVKDDLNWSVDLKDTVEVSVSGGANRLASIRRCVIVKKGTYNTRSDIFDGEIRRDGCTIKGTIREKMGLIEHILKRVEKSEEDEEEEENNAGANVSGNAAGSVASHVAGNVASGAVGSVAGEVAGGVAGSAHGNAHGNGLGHER